jgi:hypothetical protein
MPSKRLVKKYRVKRAFRALQRALVPERIRARKVERRWRRKDRMEWPPAGAGPGVPLQRYEYSLLSQNGEDGILRYLFAQAGFESRWFVEFGFGAHQCNSLRLMLHERFKGLLMDGSAENCRFFNINAERLGIGGVKAVQAFLTRDELDPLISSQGVPREIDLLSLDVDGNDYWFWEALSAVSPRIVCIEYNAGLGPELSWTVPYDPGFERFAKIPSGFFHGASLKAMERLGRNKGYRLVGCDSTGTNAFFLRDDVTAPDVPTLTAAEAYRPHANWLGRGFSEDEQLEIMKTMPYVEV